MHAPDFFYFFYSPPITQAELSDLQQLLLSKNAEIDSLHTQLLARPLSTETSERGKHPNASSKLHNFNTLLFCNEGAVSILGD